MGETRYERLAQFLEENNSAVVALREGAWLEVDGDRTIVGGQNGGEVNIFCAVLVAYGALAGRRPAPRTFPLNAPFGPCLPYRFCRSLSIKLLGGLTSRWVLIAFT